MFLKKAHSLAVAVICALGVSALSSAAHAAFTLTDLNSTATVDATGDPQGMNSWVVDGTNQLFQQWFYIRIGGQGPATSLSSFNVTAPTGNAGQQAIMTFNGTGAFTGVQVSVGYTLFGGTVGSGTSDIAESIRVINNSGQSLLIDFYQYTDFDLGGTTTDTAVVSNVNAIMQFNADGSEGSTVGVSETTTTTQGLIAQEIGPFDDILDDITSGDGDLTNTPIGVLQGPFDVTWARQWQALLAGNGGTLIISKDKHLGPIPEAGSLAIWGLLGAAALVFARRSR